MKAILHFNDAGHQQYHARAIEAGLRRHGIEVAYGQWNQPEPGDFSVCWGIKQPELFKAGPVLVLERGHVGDRLAYASAGWDGLGRRGRYPSATDGGARWRARYGMLMEPWRREISTAYALLLGQVEGDAALYDLDLPGWLQRTTKELVSLGWEVRFRPHPLGPIAAPPGSRRITGRLLDNLAGAGLCVTFNSTAAVEAVLSGIPVVSTDPGAMSWPVSGHDLHGPLVRPAREAWAWDLAWTQWTVEELASGEAWTHLQPLREV